jgi:hypothetical protein
VFTRTAPDTLVMLVQLVDRLGQGFRRNWSRRPPALLARADEVIE